jgi:DNA transformation protein
MDRETAAELFSAFGPIDVRRMFSGFGLYADDVCFGIFLRGEFYLKVDDSTIPRFMAEGSEPFIYSTRKKTVTVNSWWRMPTRLYDEPEELADWAREAVSVAARIRLKKGARKKRAAGNKQASTNLKPKRRSANSAARRPQRAVKKRVAPKPSRIAKQRLRRAR